MTSRSRKRVSRTSKRNKTSAAFNGTEVQTATFGQRHLGAPLGSTNFVEQYVQAKVAKWVDQLDRISVIAQSDPQAAYSANVHGFQNSWIY